MNSKLFPAKYLAIFLLALAFIVVATVDAFSSTEINIGSEDTYTMNASREINGKIINARINVVKTLRSKNYDLSKCTFAVELVNSNENYSAHCMEAIVKLFVVDRKEVVTGETRERFINVDLDFAPINDLNAIKQGLVDLGVSNGVASFESADLSQASNFNLHVLVVVSRKLLKDKVIIDRNLDASDYSVEKLEDGKAKISIDLKRLSGNLNGSKDSTLKIELKTLKAVSTKDAINSPNLQNTLTASSVIND